VTDNPGHGVLNFARFRGFARGSGESRARFRFISRSSAIRPGVTLGRPSRINRCLDKDVRGRDAGMTCAGWADFLNNYYRPDDRFDTACWSRRPPKVFIFGDSLLNPPCNQQTFWKGKHPIFGHKRLDTALFNKQLLPLSLPVLLVLRWTAPTTSETALAFVW
jgi:hypothetical protein